MSYIDKNLIAGEQVMYRTRLHWIVIVWQLFWTVVLVAGGIYLLVGMPGVSNPTEDVLRYARIGGGVLLVFAVLTFVVALVRRNSVEMAVTNRRVAVKIGLVSRRTQEMILNRIESITVDQTVMGRMLNYGTVVIRGTGGTSDPFPNIYHPLEFRHHVQDQLERLGTSSSLPTSAPPLR